MNIEMNRIRITASLVLLAALMIVVTSATALAADSGVNNDLFNTEEILDESTLDVKILQDWHIDTKTGTTRQKLIEIHVAEWWPGQDYRIPVRLIVPLEGKAKGFHITGGNKVEFLSKDINPNAFDAKLLANGVGLVKTVVQNSNMIPGKQGLQQEMQKLYMKDLNLRYNKIWIFSMTLMRATTAAYAEVDYFEKGKVAGSGGSKNGISPAVALINDERFTATCSSVALAYNSPTRKGDRGELQKVQAANEIFFEAAKTGEFELEAQRAKFYRSHMKGSGPSIDQMARKAGISMDELRDKMDRFMTSVCVTENWDRLRERGVDMLFQPGTHDWVAYDVLWGAQNHPQLPVYYNPNGGHEQTPHGTAFKDNQNLQAFLWHHFFGGDSLLSPPSSSHKVAKDKLTVSVRFDEGSQPISGRIWWMYDRVPAGSAPFLHVRIPEDQWMDMERDAKTGAWTATIPLKDGFDRIDFFSNHGHMTNGYKQYLSSPYTRVELETEGAALDETREGKSPTHPHVSYGPEDRQWLNLYLPSGSDPAPVFIYAHHNGSTADDVRTNWANPTLVEGTAIVSWESIAKVQSRADMGTCAADAKLMFAWVKDNAATYNLDVNNIIIGGQSRGSFVSWELAHSLDPSIAGIYMGQALPGQSFNERSLEPITKNAPPIFLAYRKEPGAVGDIHDAAHGLRVLERYKELGIEDRAELVHSLSDTKNSQVMQFLPKFVRSVVKPK